MAPFPTLTAQQRRWIAQEEDLALRVAEAITRVRGVKAPPDRRAPYFAHLRLRVAQRIRDVLLGDRTLVDARRGITVADWRTGPMAEVFFHYAPGEDYELEHEGRSLSGRVIFCRRVTFDNGILVRIAQGDTELHRRPGDSWGVASRTLPPDLSATPATAAAPDAIELDPSQRRVVDLCDERRLLVLGSAGSGKSTVALQRAGVLIARKPDAVSAAGTLAVAPTRGLARLLRRLIVDQHPEARTAELDPWLVDLTRRTLPGIDHRLAEDTPAGVMRFKRHPALQRLLPEFVDALDRSLVLSMQERAEPLHHTVAMLWVLFQDRDFLQRVVAESHGALTPDLVEEIVQRTRLQALPSAEQRYAHVSAERRETLDGRTLDAGTPEDLAGRLDVEDHALLLELHWLHRDVPGPRPRGALDHLVVDELQELAPIELSWLGAERRPGGWLTAAGDDAQQLDPGAAWSDWDSAMHALGGERVGGHHRARLEVGYRCTREIEAVARALLGAQAPARSASSPRRGAPVIRSVVPHAAERTLLLQRALQELPASVTVAIIARDRDAARQCHRELSQALPCELVRDGEFSFGAGVEITWVSQVRGLEFDCVILPDLNRAAYPDTAHNRRRLHVAVTRALHQLWLVSVGTPSPLLRCGDQMTGETRRRR